MLSRPPPYTVTSKIFHKLDWDWQFGIWKLGWGGGWGRGWCWEGRQCVSNSTRGSPGVYVGRGTVGRYVTGKALGNKREGKALKGFRTKREETQIQFYLV